LEASIYDFGMSKFRTLTAGTSLLAIALAFAACNRVDSDPDRRPFAVATTGMIAEMVARIGGEDIRVEALMPTGIDPHLFKPSQGDVQRLGRADVIFYNGLHLEGKMTDVLGRMARYRPVVAVAEQVPPDELLAVEGFEDQYDPHLWFDVRLWTKVLDPIQEALSKLLPERADAIEERTNALRAELLELDAWAEAALKPLPAERRILITAHDAFGYFGRRYGFEVLGLQGISTVSEAGLQDVERLVQRIVADRVPAIFVEASIPPRSIQAVQAACAALDHEVAIGGELFSDSMGPPGTEEGTYTGMVQHNIRTLFDALH
jgi:manganese/zinc/iron transport system substrate-binding protein